MPGRNKASVAVASAGNVQFMAAAEVSQQPAVLCTVAGMITFKSVQFFIDQPGQIFLHAGAVKITGQMRADCNAARLMDDRNHFCNRRKIRKAQQYTGPYPADTPAPSIRPDADHMNRK